MRVDAHQHFWHFNPMKDAWITEEMQVIRRDFVPSDLNPLLQSHCIEGCVAVQASQSEEENRFLLDLADANEWIRGVVGWLDLKASNLEERLEFFKSSPSFKGVRHILQAESRGFMTDPKFVQGVAMVGNHGLTYDILTKENQLDEVLHFVSSLPEMPLVIDHISKPDIAHESFDQWKKYMKLISDWPNVFVKLSGMVTEANWSDWTAETLEPYVGFCLEHFGPDRLMYGSDWPVCLLAGDYCEVFNALNKCIAGLSEAEQAAIYGKTASKFYKLED